MTRQPVPAVTVTCAMPNCDEPVTPVNPRAGRSFEPRTMCTTCQDIARLAARCLIAAVHEADDEARQDAA